MSSTTLTEDLETKLLAQLEEATREVERCFPAASDERRPAHVLYGGAHLFSKNTPAKLGELARRVFAEHAPDPNLLGDALGLPSDRDLREAVFVRVQKKLEREPIEDLRIDFEDGFGVRSDDEEDAAALAAAEALRSLEAPPPFLGVRIKALHGASASRAMRTLDLFLTRAADAVPSRFVVTLPKVSHPAQVAALCDLLEAIEPRVGIARPIAIELMIEHPGALFDEQGRVRLPALVAAARGRCSGAHLGTYDLTASFGVVAPHQTTTHLGADFARALLLSTLGGTAVQIADGATTLLPIAPHKTAANDRQRDENRAAVHRGWRAHFADVRRALSLGFDSSWDLHPSQLVSRWAAVSSFFLEARRDAIARTRAFVDNQARATRVGGTFDDAATGRGLFAFFRRGVACGALDADDLRAAGLAPVSSP